MNSRKPGSTTCGRSSYISQLFSSEIRKLDNYIPSYLPLPFSFFKKKKKKCKILISIFQRETSEKYYIH